MEIPEITPEPQKPKWYYSIWFVLVMLFLVMGPFGVPLLWKSPRFPKWAKIALTIAVALYTYWLIAATLAMTRAIMDQYRQLQSLTQ